MAEITYPTDLLQEGWAFRFARMQAMGPNTLSGNRQVFAMPPGGPGADGRWVASISYKLSGATQIRAFRTLIARLQGMINYTRIPVCDPHSANHAATANPLAAAAKGASVVRFADTAFAGKALNAGGFITIDGWLYQITDYSAATPGEHIVTLEPSLRVAASTSSVANTKASVLMRLATAEQGLAFLDLGRAGNVSLTFIEAFDGMTF